MTTYYTAVRGIVRDGQGRVSKLGERRLQGRRAFCQTRIHPGTLNVHPPGGAEAALRELGPCHLTQRDDLDEMDWWRIWVRNASGGFIAPAWIIRGLRSKAHFLELVSDVHFREECRIKSGDELILELH